jgi:hypothetical protein
VWFGFFQATRQMSSRRYTESRWCVPWVQSLMTLSASSPVSTWSNWPGWSTVVMRSCCISPRVGDVSPLRMRSMAAPLASTVVALS